MYTKTIIKRHFFYTYKIKKKKNLIYCSFKIKLFYIKGEPYNILLSPINYLILMYFIPFSINLASYFLSIICLIASYASFSNLESTPSQ